MGQRDGDTAVRNAAKKEKEQNRTENDKQKEKKGTKI